MKLACLLLLLNFSHVVVVIQENRSFDNLFMGFPGAHTVQAGKDHLNRTVPLKPAGFQVSTDPNHAHADLLRSWNGGKMNGFDLLGYSQQVSLPVPQTFAYAYVPRVQTAAYWKLAAAYGLADHMFSSALAPTFPGHMTLIAGQGPIDDPSNLPWGCNSPAGTLVAMPAGPPQFPCFDYATLGGLLDAKGMSWKYYTNNDYPYNNFDATVGAYVAIRPVYESAEFAQKNVPRYDFFADVQACRLPAVSYITPDGGASDHAGVYGWNSGPDWVSLIYRSIVASHCPDSYYDDTAMLVTWDDSGSWYDEVPPPLDTHGQPLGMRVPLIFIAAKAKPHYVSTKQHDFGSILHFIESNFGLGYLSDSHSAVVTRDVLADDLSDMWTEGGRIAPLAQNQLSVTGRFHDVGFFRNHQSTKPVDDQ